MSKVKITKDKWIWMPHPAHFICARDCKFFMATKVGKYIVSTVGEYLPDYQIRELYAETRKVNLEGRGDARLADYMKKIGFEDLRYDGWKYETIVFGATKRRGEGEGCCPWTIIVVSDNKDEIAYKTAEEAYRGHYKLCNKWAKK